MTPTWLRRAFGALSGAAGTVVILWLVIAMNALDRGPREPPPQRAQHFDVQQKKKPPPTSRPRPKPRPRKTNTPPPPIPMLASAVGGLDLGLFGGAAIDLSEGTDALLGDTRDVVMTADAVDALPTPISQSAPPYPSAARSKGVTGHVTLSLSFDAAGRLTGVEILEAEPPGYFEDAAEKTVRMWQFQPATYQGAPVPVTGVELVLDFDLER